MLNKQLTCALSSLLIATSQMAFTTQASAAPIQYQISGTIEGELIGISVSPSDYPVAPDTPFSASFYYDPSAPILSGTAVGALSNLVGSLGDFQFSASNGEASTVVAGNNFGLSFFNVSNGFTANGLTFSGMAVVFLNGSYSHDELPLSLNQGGEITLFMFLDSDNKQHQYLASPNTLSQVPTPSAAFLFGSGIIALSGAVRRNRKM